MGVGPHEHWKKDDRLGRPACYRYLVLEDAIMARLSARLFLVVSALLASVVLIGTSLLRAQARPAAPAQAAGHITSPKEAWGHNVGDDFFLAE